MAAVGMLSSISTGSWNPVTVINSLGMGVPALLLIIISTWITCQVSLYSGGLAVANLFPRVNNKKGTLFLGLVMIMLAVLKVINYFEVWLLLLENLFTPMLAIALIKFFFFSNRLTIKKIDWSALLSLAISFLLNMILTLPKPSFATSMLCSEILYVLFISIEKILARRFCW